MLIRPAAPDDSRKIAEVHLATWKSAYAGIVSREYLDSLELEPRKLRWDEILRRSTANETTLVAVVDEKVVGFLSAGPNRTPNLGFEGEIHALYLHRDFQKRRIGLALFEHGLNELRKMAFKSAAVWVLKDNPSRYFYERMGGREVEEKPIRIGGQDLMEIAYGWDAI